MSAPSLRISLYEGRCGLSIPATGVWFVYAPEGDVTVEAGDGSRTLAADDGTFAAPGTRVGGAGLAWFYEVATRSAPFAMGIELFRSQVLAIGFGPPFLVRADRIESQPGAVTPRHGHRGPGIRRLVFGRIMAEVGDGMERIEAGHSWFEAGPDLVVGTNIGGGNAAFVRVMVLPMELEGGKSSFMPADETEARKPRSVASRLFGEVVLQAADVSGAT